MFKIELKFKIADHEVSWEKFATSFLAEAFRSAQNELHLKPTSVHAPAVLSRSVEEGKSQAPRAVGVEEAARLLSISPHTGRSCVARRTASDGASDWGLFPLMHRRVQGAGIAQEYATVHQIVPYGVVGTSSRRFPASIVEHGAS
jgi:hypothetical protein